MASRRPSTSTSVARVLVVPSSMISSRSPARPAFYGERDA
jgi:hypothetical protein